MRLPTAKVWDTSLHVVRYIKHAPGQGLLMSRHSASTPSSHCDSAWGSCPMSGLYRILCATWKVYCILEVLEARSCLLFFSQVRVQGNCSKSVTSEITWLLALLKDINVPNLETVQLYQRSPAQCL